jgi:phosphonate transport system ATP-binding protein
MPTPLLAISALTKIYPNGVTALRNVNFQVHQGDFLCVVGLSGSGKSTLLRCINKIHDATSGSIQFNNREIATLAGRPLRRYRSDIGMIFQQFNLLPRRSVLTNVLTGKLFDVNVARSLFGLFSSEDKQQALKNIDIVGLTGKERTRADNLSGGQQQRVAIARAMMQSPLMLLADEPVASLDPATSHSVMKYLAKINREMGVTIICNLHFLSLVREYASRVLALKEGRVLFDGKPQEIDDAWFECIYGDNAHEVTID